MINLSIIFEGQEAPITLSAMSARITVKNGNYRVEISNIESVASLALFTKSITTSSTVGIGVGSMEYSFATNGEVEIVYSENGTSIFFDATIIA